MTSIVPARLSKRGVYLKPVLGAFACALLLSACMPAYEDNQQTSTTVESRPQQEQPVDNSPGGRAYQLLQQAEQAVSPERERLILDATDLYLSVNDSSRAGRALDEIDRAVLPAGLYQRYALLMAPMAASRRNVEQVLEVLADPRFDLASLASKDKSTVYQLRAEAYEAKGRVADAINERISQSLQTPQTIEQQPISDAIWALLTKSNSPEIEFLNHAEFGTSIHEQMLAGWVSLMQHARAGEVNDWRARWPLHPANRFSPKDLNSVAVVVDKPAVTGLDARVALLVPITGKLAAEGKRVRDGFLSMHYSHIANGESATQINVIDSASQSAASAYQQAVNQGAEVVIGPLAREAVSEIARLPESLNVTTLALNQVAGLETSQNFYQFGLNPEDDARQIVEYARSKNANNALILAPAGSRGERLLQAMSESWKVSAMEAPKTARYAPNTGNFTTVLAQAIGLELASGKLAAGRTLPDAILFIGSANDAAMMKEALNGVNAGTVPLYLSSQTIGNKRKPQFDRLDDAHVCVAPWQIGRGPLADGGDSAAQATDLLYAMGADARELYGELNRLSLSSSVTVSGNTGYLSLDERRRVLRKLICGQIQNGQLNAVASY